MYRGIGGSCVQAYGSIVGNGQPPDSNGNIQPSTDIIFTEWQYYISSSFQAICYTQSNCG